MYQALTESSPTAAAQARSLARSQWLRDCEYLLDRYLDNRESVETLKEQLRRLYPNNAQAMLDNLLTLNLVRKLVDTRAKLYRKAPTRRLLDGDGAQLAADHPAPEVMHRLYRSLRVNACMKWATRLMELLNASVIWGQVDWRERRPVLTVLPPHRLLVEPDPEQPTSLKAARRILVPLGDGGFVSYRRFRDGLRRRDGIEVLRLDAEGQPLARQPAAWRAYEALEQYPFLCLRKDEPCNDEVFPDAPQSLLLAARWLDHELTRGALNSRQTDFPAYVYNGTPEELGSVNPATGAGAIICLGAEDKELKRLMIDPREEARNRNLQFFLKLFAQANHITPSVFSFDAELLSGTAKFHDKQPEIEYREDLIDILSTLEREELWPMIRQLAGIAGFSGAAHVAGLGMTIEFGDPVIPLSREEELRILEREIRLGLRSVAEVLAERRGLELEEAERLVRHNRELNRAADAGEAAKD